MFLASDHLFPTRKPLLRKIVVLRYSCPDYHEVPIEETAIFQHQRSLARHIAPQWGVCQSRLSLD